MNLIDVDKTRAATEQLINELRDSAAEALQVEKDTVKSAELAAQRRGAEQVLALLDLAPRITKVEVVAEGKWTRAGRGPRMYYQCSVCKAIFSHSIVIQLGEGDLPKRCPRCTARLKGI